MLVYGCDFSGAKDPDGKIFVTIGELKQHVLTIEAVIPCEDRLDLYYRIKNQAGPWGLDFPFSIPNVHLDEHYKSSWECFIGEAYADTRLQFKTRFGKIHSGRNNIRDCRVTDLAVGGKSPISETPISMNGMLYGGRKLLGNLRNEAAVYPFDHHRESAARLYEVYPSHGWTKLGLNREDTSAIARLPEQFKLTVDAMFDIRLSPSLIPIHASGPKIGKLIDHASDSMMACITLAYGIYSAKVDEDWEVKPPFATSEEWLHRHREGLVVRIG
ncbi:hypothetical protein FHS16_006435 [Paenibacillus endophyticus]|uniref:DUF429 domain-containing protein n=1 Tax=Paenibacillus endophyticus TaxID=1294268 RepID=A0A7W5GDW0_9BACL|nr:hypothetical protein [Paenibacillus endophyticus]MBB3156311.1 hypothetical protein [Paenibacillus endophyticus]